MEEKVWSGDASLKEKQCVHMIYNQLWEACINGKIIIPEGINMEDVLTMFSERSDLATTSSFGKKRCLK